MTVCFQNKRCLSGSFAVNMEWLFDKVRKMVGRFKVFLWKKVDDAFMQKSFLDSMFLVLIKIVKFLCILIRLV